MNPSLRMNVLRVLKSMGAFGLARRATAKGLRILGYHGASLRDEHLFNPVSFMKPSTFESRMVTLKRSGLEILDLDEAVGRLLSDELNTPTVVVTIDDGWRSTYRFMLPILRNLGIPATVYVTTYYVEHEAPVFNVGMAYLSWWVIAHGADSRPIASLLAQKRPGGVGAEGGAFTDALRWGESLCPGKRTAFLKQCAYAVGHPDPDQVLEMFSLVSRQELKDMVDQGFSVQLHTHRHSLPRGSRSEMRNEVERNLSSLQPYTTEPLEHFCYPSGQYDANQVEWLREMGILSATTTSPGINTSSADLLTLKRYLDSEALTHLDLEAELNGVLEVGRKVAGRSSTTSVVR